MNRDCVLRATLACALMTPVASPAADEYWSYSYRDIDVTAEGTSAYAINLARYCVRLDGLLTRVLGIKSTDRTPMHIYALPSAQVRQLLGDSARVSYRISENGNTVIMANTAARDSDYWGAYFGYTAALLASDGGQGIRTRHPSASIRVHPGGSRGHRRARRDGAAAQRSRIQGPCIAACSAHPRRPGRGARAVKGADARPQVSVSLTRAGRGSPNRRGTRGSRSPLCARRGSR